MTAQPSQHKLILPLEGYRALAILAVLIFHLDKTFLPGGYLGVDLFFVISGFIITKGIIKAREAGTFKLSTFYAKRFWRLFPALLATTLVTLIFAYSNRLKSLLLFNRCDVRFGKKLQMVRRWQVTISRPCAPHVREYTRDEILKVYGGLKEHITIHGLTFLWSAQFAISGKIFLKLMIGTLIIAAMIIL